MSNFMCEICGTTIIDTPKGYMTGCRHHPIDNSSSCTGKHKDDVMKALLKERFKNRKPDPNWLDDLIPNCIEE